MAACTDLAVVLPGIRFIPTMVDTVPYLSSSCHWTAEDEWLSFHAYALPRNLAGHRYRPVEPPGPSAYCKRVRGHVARVVQNLRRELTRTWWSDVHKGVVEAATSTETSKYAIIAARLQCPGPPLHIALDRIALPSHRSALSSFLCGDWFLAVYAKNYFARNLVPQTVVQVQKAIDAGTTETMVCMACWHYRREAFLEDEFHVLCVCPEYAAARQDLVASGVALNHHRDMLKSLECSSKAEAEQLAKFMVRTRQIRRKLKVAFESLSEAALMKSFPAKRAAWRFRRRACCRHGVLFDKLPDEGCKCMKLSSSVDADWELARFMPALSHSLKIIVAVPFQKDSFVSLGRLQHQARQLGW